MAICGRNSKAEEDAPKPGLEYEVDFDDDGLIDRRSDRAEWTYEGPGTHTITVIVRDARWGTQKTLTQKVKVP